ncbi:MAG: MBL fold metallo-hydrolase [Gammaproteobacteria bacterium]|nr:MBL fold metallo-hydrolase [Gammaproteobacteria bacterium]MBT8110832.1 MBL fold metallo-hydrolase [Gammaproteobacteria bacterium]NNL45531.1 MBL fold metallo-hydrolase [Woeseiaceae bacterium]
MPEFSELEPGVRRLVAPNPSMMTGPGTNTYLFGTEQVAVLDPGPAIESHIERIQKFAGAEIRWILVTHTHPDHSPAAAKLAAMTGAQLLGMSAPETEYQDATFKAVRELEDGDELASAEFVIEAVHTPGHASNHLCYRHVGLNWLFTGDHIIDGSTVVINPPDGNMKHYLQSLQRARQLQCDALAPGHGEIIRDPDRAIDWLIDHRLERERKVRAALAKSPNLTTRDLVPHVYRDVDMKLYALAERSLLAHLLKLEDDGVATCVNERWLQVAAE